VRDSLAQVFLRHYEGFGFATAAPVPLTSGVDSSVIFVGSSISVLKPLIRRREVPERGVTLAQPALRTHNIKKLLQPGFEFEWGGLFTNIALLAPVGTEVELLRHTLAFFIDSLGFRPDDLRLRVSTADPDLFALCRGPGRPVDVEVDTHPLPYYRHRIGMDGVVGRNFNFALYCPRYGEYRDVGNFIVFEDVEGEYSFLEVGFGDTTILRARYDLEHVLDCFPFRPQGSLPPAERRILEDAASVSVALWREGLRPSSRDASSKLLAKYMRALYHVADRNGVSLAALRRVVAEYEAAQYRDPLGVADELVAHLSTNAPQIKLAVPAGTATTGN
jgi:hypothetical protein